MVIYGAGALTLLWFSSTIVGAVNNVPVVSTPPISTCRPCQRGRLQKAPTNFDLHGDWQLVEHDVCTRFDVAHAARKKLHIVRPECALSQSVCCAVGLC